nr:uncharacterized protein DDB_G0289357-like [Maniola hyperantus]
MDDLYDNLENYYDEKIIDELKNENKELKTKLEEYSSAMTRLQMNILQDFDKLHSEYKKLEMNYSSLLKTARAEIERKADMIKSLNTEKDLLIIKTLQTTGKNISNTRRFNKNNTQQLKKSYEIETKCTAKPQPEPPSGNQKEEKRPKNDSNIEPIFSSDDDYEALNLKNTRRSPLREDTRHYDKYRSRDNFSKIKHTAVNPLEDPRVASNKYVIKNNKGITVLSTVVSEDFDIKPVNVSSWEISNKEKFMIPPTFPTRRLSEDTDNDFVNEIYLNIDKPLLNDSLESGEIQILNDDVAYYTKENDRDKRHENKKVNKDHSKTLNSLEVLDSNKINPSINKNEIPNTKKPDKITTTIKHEDFNLSTKQKFASNLCNEIKKQEIEKHDKVITLNTENVIIDEQYKNCEVSKRNTVLPENTLTGVNCTLADDLELSDEANESRDIQNDVKKSKKILHKDKPSVVSLDDKQKGDMPLVEDENRESKEKNKSLNLKKVTKDSSRDSGKNRKTKKKTEVKDANCTEAKEQNKKLQTFTKLKTNPAISIQTKHKFSDLFGDSSSLITPDDLGISTPDIKLPLAAKYASIFDNTQDAVDLSVEDINRVQSNACEVSAFPTIREDQSNDKTCIEKAKNDDEKLLVSKDLDKNATTNNSLENNLYQKDRKSGDSEIVKTVIISTGVQPKYTSESNLLQGSQKCGIENADKTINNDEANMKTCVLNTINALATSTPQKTEHVYIIYSYTRSWIK